MAEERKDLELEAEEARASREADASVQPEADAGEPEEQAKPGALESALYTWAQAAVIAVVGVVLLFTFFVRLISVNGPSMQDTLYTGDQLLVLNAMFCDFKAGDVVVINDYNAELSETIVKRIIAVGGQTVDIDFASGVVYVDGEARKVVSARVHKGSVIAKLDGVDTVEEAMRLKGKTVQIRRADAKLPEGAFFLADILGLDVVDQAGEKLGVLKEVLSPSRQQVYVVAGEREILIPAVPEFILETNIEGGYLKVRLIEGM